MVDDVTFLLENVTQLLAQEANLLGGVEDQFRLLQNELSLINVFLQNLTEGKRYTDELVKEVVSQIRDVAYEAEDVIDTFIVNAIMHRKRSQFGKLIHHWYQEIALHDVAKKIESINIVIREINDNRSKYGIEISGCSGGGAESEVILHRRRRFVEEDHVVGFSHDTEVLLKELVEGSPRRHVVSIIGMGGLGKTTLARKIYNNHVVCNYFGVRAWVYLSQEYRLRDLLLEILKSVKPTPQLMILKEELHQELFQILEAKYSLNKDKFEDSTLFTHLEDMKEKYDGEFKEMLFKELNRMEDSGLRDSLQSLVEKIYEKNCEELQDFTDDELKKGLFRCLTGRRYLIVLDDIWNTNLWEISAAFPDKLNGSRILITSRIKQVALHASAYSPPYELPFLDEDKSWELFSKKVFRGDACPPELETLGRMIVKSCHGLPLSIVILGGLFASKEKTHRTWSKYISHVNLYLTENISSCRDILALSYNDLPRRLKSCFLYFGIYPEDFEIPVRQLIQLWIAEGFIRQIHNRNVEDVAEGYLEELIDHGLIQVATRRADGGVKTCRIHDLLRDMCIWMSAEQKFLEVSSNASLPPIGTSRRLSIQRANATNLDISLNHVSTYTRSLLCLGGETLNAESKLKWDCKTLKLVRVVDLGNMATLIPKKIERLILLRYLRIQTGELEVMPASICSLWNLEILDMRNSKIKRLPKEVWRLQKLKHLYLGGPTSLPRTNNKSLPNLLVLTGIATNQDTESLLAKDRFPSVKKLGLHSLSGVGSTLLSSLHPLAQLQTLKINGLFDLPSPVSFHLNLTKITLLCMNISPTVVKVLGSLTNLRILKIRGVDPVQMNLNCDGSSFPLLETFKMANLEIIYWNMQRGAMPSLQHLVINSCKYLYMLPDELWCLTSLRDVEVFYPSATLARKLRQLQVKSGCKLQAYPPLSESN